MIRNLKKDTWDHQTYLQAVAQIDATLRKSASDGMAGEAMDVEDAGRGQRKGAIESTGDSMMTQQGEEQGIPDMVWVEETTEVERKEGTRLDVELRGYLSNLIKESIRVSPFIA